MAKELREGKEKSNMKNVTTPKPKIVPAPQTKTKPTLKPKIASPPKATQKASVEISIQEPTPVETSVNQAMEEQIVYDPVIEHITFTPEIEAVAAPVELQPIVEINTPGFNEQVISLLEKLNDKLDILINNKDIVGGSDGKLSSLSLNELQVLRVLANEAVMRNKFPDGDQNLLRECSTLAFKTDEEVRNRLKLFQ